LIEDEPVTPLDAAALPNAHGSPQHHHHSHHHHPSWSLRNEDRHPDLWPWSRGSKSSSTRVVKTAVTPTTPEPVKAEISPLATSDESELPTRTADTQRSKQNVASAIPLTTSSPVEQRAQWAKAQKEEYDRNCGALWTDYRECLQVRSSGRWPTLTWLISLRRAACYRRQSPAIGLAESSKTGESDRRSRSL
jgi:hypothetical protein